MNEIKKRTQIKLTYYEPTKSLSFLRIFPQAITISEKLQNNQIEHETESNIVNVMYRIQVKMLKSTRMFSWAAMQAQQSSRHRQ